MRSLPGAGTSGTAVRVLMDIRRSPAVVVASPVGPAMPAARSIVRPEQGGEFREEFLTCVGLDQAALSRLVLGDCPEDLLGFQARHDDLLAIGAEVPALIVEVTGSVRRSVM